MSEIYGYMIRYKPNPKGSPKKVWAKVGHMKSHINLNKSRYYKNIQDYEIVELIAESDGKPMIDFISPEKLIEVLQK